MGQGISRDACLAAMVMLTENPLEVVNKVGRVSKDSVNRSDGNRSNSPLLRPQCHDHQADDEQEADGAEDAAGAAHEVDPHVLQVAVPTAGQEPLQGLVGVGHQQSQEEGPADVADVVAGIDPEAEGITEAQKAILSEVRQFPHGGIGEGVDAHFGQPSVQHIREGLAAGRGEGAGFQGVMEDEPQGPQHQDGEEDAEEDEQDMGGAGAFHAKSPSFQGRLS